MFFFFKQKTAYEMRISDWSSDVCSSDLAALSAEGRSTGVGVSSATASASGCMIFSASRFNSSSAISGVAGSGDADSTGAGAGAGAGSGAGRSEEHTSELQSLMRISYAVFCLKNKNKINSKPEILHTHYTRLRYTQ